MRPKTIFDRQIKQVTVGLSIHRPEMIPLTAALMRAHEALFLEEPPAPGFHRMLQGTVSIDDYLMAVDVEYPTFSRHMCHLLCEQKRAGKKIFQVEPFLEKLFEIHLFFAQGHSPSELNHNSDKYPVYLAEKNATGALLAYYQTAMTASFEDTLQTVLRFARFDAARLRLRDELRVKAMIPLLQNFRSSYIEAGVIHFALWRQLRQQMTDEYRVNPVFLADAALKKIGETGHLYGPGDQLTLLYIFHPKISGTLREWKLAARSLIYSKLIAKEELTDDVENLPHLRNELACIRTTQRLSLDDCRRLFPIVRRVHTVDARQIVNDYLVKKSNSSGFRVSC